MKASLRALSISGLLVTFGLAGATLPFSPLAHAKTAQGQPILEYPFEETNRIEGLEWNPKPQFSRNIETGVTIAKVRGTYSRQDRTLIWGGKPVRINRKGEFEIVFEVVSEVMVIRLQSVGPFLKKESETIQLNLHGESDGSDISIPDHPGSAQSEPTVATDLNEPQAPEKHSAPKDYSFITSIGVTSLNYSFLSKSARSQTNWTGKASATYNLSSHFNVGANGYVGIAALKKDQQGLFARALGLNARIGYRAPILPEPWSFNLMAGWYYTSLLTTDGSTGYQGIMGPQLYPQLRRSFWGGGSAFVYFKYSPISDGGTALLSMSNRELALGGGWLFPMFGSNAVSLTLDYANLKLVVGNEAIQSKSTTFSVGLEW